MTILSLYFVKRYARFIEPKQTNKERSDGMMAIQRCESPISETNLSFNFKIIVWLELKHPQIEPAHRAHDQTLQQA